MNKLLKVFAPNSEETKELKELYVPGKIWMHGIRY